MTNYAAQREILVGENLAAACDPFARDVQVATLRRDKGGVSPHAAMFGRGPLTANEMKAFLGGGVDKVTVLSLADKGGVTSPAALGTGMANPHAIRRAPDTKPAANAPSMEVR